ncbi:hypothetical protein PV-S19_0225 [Pacmanvirus S19]|nr:hypothetical protein PV-S19_0225 [Pacmanvirus S19]
MSAAEIRGITVLSLTKRNDDRKIVQTIVNDQIRVIDAKILTNHSSGANSIEHDLPINFNINSMDKADAQTMVYSELIKAYVGKGFNKVFIDLGIKPKLYIYWLNGMDEYERAQRQKIINRHRMK